MLKPLAPTLVRLVLRGDLGGTITEDIGAFTKLTELNMAYCNYGTFV